MGYPCPYSCLCAFLGPYLIEVLKNVGDLGSRKRAPGEHGGVCILGAAIWRFMGSYKYKSPNMRYRL